MKCISNLLLDRRNTQLRNYAWKLGCYWNNGNCIEVLPVNDSIRGHRFNGVIIENEIEEIERDIINSLIMPYLMVRIDSTGHKIEEFNNVKERIFTVDIKCEDIKESELAKFIKAPVYYHNKMNFLEMRRYDEALRKIMTVSKELGLFKKENKNMFNNYTIAYRVAQVGTDKIYIYNAIGIPKENIKYETEFVNRTKETYLNIKGEHKVEDIGFENDIDVHLLIDTNIYDKYEVEFHDGLVIVVLHEIINEKPVLEDVSSEKGE